jgi:hypothetical protein
LRFTFDDNDTMSETILLPVIELNIARPWQVGRVLFHPAGAAGGMIEAARAGSENDALQPEEQWQVLQASTRLNRRMANKSWLVAFQGFGLPGRVNTASYDFINLRGGRMKPEGVPEVGVPRGGCDHGRSNSR